MSRVENRYLTTVDSVGHSTDGEHAVAQRFPIDPHSGSWRWRGVMTTRSWTGCGSAAPVVGVVPMFGLSGQPEYLIEIHLGSAPSPTLKDLETALCQLAR